MPAAAQTMTTRERKLAVMRYQRYDRLPIVHFGFWRETLQKWAQEGHVTAEEANGWGDGNAIDEALSARLGFDGNWSRCYSPAHGMRPGFETQVLKEFPDGTRHIRNGDGVVVVQKPEAGSIPAEISHLLVDRASWEEHYKWRFAWSEERITQSSVRAGERHLKWSEGGLEHLRSGERNNDDMLGLFCGSLYGSLRNLMGVEGACYILADDEDLFTEIIDTNADCIYRNVEYVLQAGAKFDFAHMWEDICYKNGPLITPSVFAEKCGPHYRRLTELLKRHGIDLVSLDCDGMIDALLPIWLENGVNTMFPIEVGTWEASLAPWRKKYGRELRGVGGMDKRVFAQSRAAVDAEVERLRVLVDLGGYIPCPDHRIAPDGQWDLVRYYCERMRKVFG